MYALSGKEPWWSLICFGEKHIETRSWHPADYVNGARIALHISATLAPADRESCYHDSVFRAALERHGVTFRRRARDYEGDESYDPVGLLPAGHIVATCIVAGWMRMRQGDIPPQAARWVSSHVDGWNFAQEYAFGHYAEGRYAWVLKDVRRLATPIPAKGHLGLWPVGPAELEAIHAQQAA